jgi:hypothetical protein
MTRRAWEKISGQLEDLLSKHKDELRKATYKPLDNPVLYHGVYNETSLAETFDTIKQRMTGYFERMKEHDDILERVNNDQSNFGYGKALAQLALAYALALRLGKLTAEASGIVEE